MQQPEIFITEDGSCSLFSKDFNESYHSKYGAINESKHVFINAGFKSMNMKKSFNILEIGFGTGLNALLTIFESEAANVKVHYHTIEPYPVSASVYQHLNYAEFLSLNANNYYLALHESEWGKDVFINPLFILHKHINKLEEIELQPNFYYLIYFDAFSPEVQPELWTPEIFHKIYQSMKGEGTLVTYSAKGSVRRNLMIAGFKVQRIPGPKGKREMIRAVKS